MFAFAEVICDECWKEPLVLPLQGDSARALTVLSADDPVRVFQDFATLDLISKGRAEMIVGLPSVAPTIVSMLAERAVRA